MAADQYIIDTYNAIKALLMGHAPFWSEMNAGNFLDFTDGRAVVKKYAVPQKQPGDYPMVELKIGTTSTDTATNETAHYGDDVPGSQWLEMLGESFVIVITSESSKVNKSQLLEQEAKTAIRRAGAKLGIDEVFTWEMRTVRREDDTGRNGVRRITEITIPVQFRFTSAALTA